MSHRQSSALRIVTREEVFRETIEEASQQGEPHSLHSLISLPSDFHPNHAAYFIDRYSQRGQIVLDPFARSGSVALESALLGRGVEASDRDALSVHCVQAKLEPADIAEVTLCLSLTSLARPVPTQHYRESFSPFYDVDTYREIVNMKRRVESNDDRVSRFVGALSAALLHGHSAGYFSTYSIPHISLRPSEQDALNDKRGQNPSYRPIAPRILKKASMALSDGIPSILERRRSSYRVRQSDARDLQHIASSGVNLIVTALPILGGKSRSRARFGQHHDQWLRRWFFGLDPLRHEEECLRSSEEDFLAEVLFEMARVLCRGGRAVLRLPRGSSLSGDHFFTLLASQSRYFEAEGSFATESLQKKRLEHLGGQALSQEDSASEVYVVIRRK